MAEARQDADWDHTSNVLALLFNCHRDPKSTEAASPRDFHPTRRGKEVRQMAPVSALKALFNL
jgi:hypothetical protein